MTRRKAGAGGILTQVGGSLSHSLVVGSGSSLQLHLLLPSGSTLRVQYSYCSTLYTGFHGILANPCSCTLPAVLLHATAPLPARYPPLSFLRCAHDATERNPPRVGSSSPDASWLVSRTLQLTSKSSCYCTRREPSQLGEPGELP